MTDPTITIAGLEARINSLLSAVQHSNRTTAERDALAAQLAEVRAELAAAPKVCAIHSYALEGPCMTCGAPWPGAEKALRQERIEGMEKMLRISRAVGCPNSVEEVVEAVAAIKADLASERARLAACQTRIAGLEQAANERSAEVARLTARVAELEARPVLTHEILSAAIKKARRLPPYIARQAADEYMPHLGPVTLPAQDRAEELVSSLGAPPTSPPDARPVFAGASVEELVVQYLMAGDPGLDPGVARSMVSGPRRAGVAAVLARLEVSLVAPVDPEAVSRQALRPLAVTMRSDEVKRSVENVRATLTAAGIPVTPEVGK